MTHVLLLPTEGYGEWFQAAMPFILKFGPQATKDPNTVGNLPAPVTVTIVDTGASYPGQGDIRAWFGQTLPQVAVDYVRVADAEQLKSTLQGRIDSNVAVPEIKITYPWPAGKCLVGLHGRADGPQMDADFDVMRRARLESVKLLSWAPPEDFDRVRALNPKMFVLVRLFTKIGAPDQFSDFFVAEVQDAMARFYQRGVRYFEIHNEPNLKLEGWGSSWADGSAFNRFFIEVRNKLKAKFPEALFGYPGLSPDGFPMPERTNDIVFLDQCREAVQLSDWIGAHCYWTNPDEMRSEKGGMSFMEFRKRFPEKLIFITEFSNPANWVGRAEKAHQYVQYYELLRNVPGLGAAFCFLSSASAQFPHEAWWDENGAISEIPDVVGGRKY